MWLGRIARKHLAPLELFQLRNCVSINIRLLTEQTMQCGSAVAVDAQSRTGFDVACDFHLVSPFSTMSLRGR